MKNQYKMLCGMSASDLTVNVQNYLDDGWQVYGQPFKDGVMLYQAVTK